MIRDAKILGWLQCPTSEFETWSQLNGVLQHEVKVAQIKGRGTGLLAKNAVKNSENGAECLLTVPRDLILSLEYVKQHAHADRDLREVLDSMGEFGQTARGAILVFLLLQMSTVLRTHLGVKETIGVHTNLTDYVKSLPLEALPTTWQPAELAVLIGTTLAPATSHKLKSLHREYDQLCTSAAKTRWFSLMEDHLQFEDWLCVDAMYRSRALDYPGIGHCMVPYLDLANHNSGDATIAVYDLDKDGNAILLLRDGHELKPGDEVTISYGDEKGACEMLFSYGFLDPEADNARSLFLSLDLSGDPLASAKRSIADCAPGVKIMDAGDSEMDWKSDFIWLLCVNAEDGLHFDVARLNDGTEEMRGFLGEHELTKGGNDLPKLLGKSELWPVYRLRAVALLQQRVHEQLEVLTGTEEQVENAEPEGGSASINRYRLAVLLRDLEMDLLMEAYEDFEKQKIELAEDETVSKYLQAMNMNDEEEEEEDFS